MVLVVILMLSAIVGVLVGVIAAALGASLAWLWGLVLAALAFVVLACVAV